MLTRAEKRLYDFLFKSVCPDLPNQDKNYKPRLVVIKSRKDAITKNGNGVKK